ncbi:MAG: FAD-dependent oxidoreductase [Mycetocola sp.]
MEGFFDVLIVGAGHGGVQVLASLRANGFTGTVGVLDASAEFPYERPPVSKDILAGKIAPEEAPLRPARFWSEPHTQLLLSTRVTSVDAWDKVVETKGGDQFRYRYLVWAAGAEARKLSLPGVDLKGVHYLRTLEDVRGVLADLDATERAVVIGGGYIGMESAAALRARGIPITLIESQARVMARTTSATVSNFLESEHAARGVVFKLEADVRAFVGASPGHVSGVELADGRAIPADLVLIGIGIVPSIEPLVRAGAQASDGIVVDENCWTSLDGVLAVGDCTRQPDVFRTGKPVRIESIQNAVEQGKVAAAAISNAKRVPRTPPRFWSNQFGHRIRTVGLQQPHDSQIIRGSFDAGSFSVLYVGGDVVRAIDCVNAPADFASGRLLIERRTRIPDLGVLADSNVPLKSLM